MRVIDAHNHAMWYGMTPARHVENMDRCGIAATWLLTWEAPEDEREPSFLRVSNPLSDGLTLADAVRTRDAFPERFVVGYCPDPRRPGALDRLEAAIALHGVRTCGEWKFRLMFDDVDNLRLLRFGAEHRLPVTVHVSYPGSKGRGYPRPDYWYAGGMEAVERALRAVPEVVVVGHGPGFWATISGDGRHLTETYPSGPVAPGGALPRMMREYPNLWADLSAKSGLNALQRDREFGRDFLLEFQDRILYARDFFDNAHREYLESLDLPGDALQRILGGNAERLVPLTDALPAHGGT